MALRISQKCEQQGVFLTLFCILAAWARTELAMLLEKGYTPATWVVPRMSHNSPNYLWCVSVSGLVSDRGMGLYGAHHAPKIY